MNIMHLSFDIPDEFVPNKTVAVKNVIDISNNVSNKNFYISMNRSNNIKMKRTIISNDHISINMFGYPYGILLTTTLKRFYKEIKYNAPNLNKIDKIHCHKLTYEGYIGYLLNKDYNIPYMISIRFTDFKILRVRKDLTYLYKKVIKNSDKIFCISPWMIRALEDLFGNAFFTECIKDKITILPNVIKTHNYETIKDHNGKYVTIFNITSKNLKVKNIFKTLQAIKIINESENHEKIYLDIIGDGDAKIKLKKYIDSNNMTQYVCLKGAIENTKLLEDIKKYKGFILCSYPETFGLVYIEALIKGLPIVYTKNAGIDGYFNEFEIGESVDHSSIYDIKNAILNLDKNYNEYKLNIAKMHSENYLNIFSLDYVANLYSNTTKS